MKLIIEIEDDITNDDLIMAINEVEHQLSMGYDNGTDPVFYFEK